MIYEKIQALLLLLSKQYSISNAVLRHALSQFAAGQLIFCFERYIFSEASSPFHASLLLVDIVIEYTMSLDLIESKFYDLWYKNQPPDLSNPL